MDIIGHSFHHSGKQGGEVWLAASGARWCIYGAQLHTFLRYAILRLTILTLKKCRTFLSFLKNACEVQAPCSQLFYSSGLLQTLMTLKGPQQTVIPVKCTGRKHHLPPGLAHWGFRGVTSIPHGGLKPLGKSGGRRPSPGQHKNQGASLRCKGGGLVCWGMGSSTPQRLRWRVLWRDSSLFFVLLIFLSELEASLN